MSLGRHEPLVRRRCTVVLTAALVLCGGIPVNSAEKDGARPEPGSEAFFRTQVQPILKARCLKCHGGEAKIKGNFRLDSREGILRGGDLGPAVTLDRPDESLLLQAIRYDGLEMPPSGKLAAAEIDVLTRWVKEGLVWPANERKTEPARESRRREPSPRATAPRSPDGRIRRSLAPRSAGQEPPVGPQPDRCVRPGQAGGRGAATCAAGRQGGLDPPGHLRPDRPAADSGRG